MMKYIRLFFKCGVVGWCVEIIFTALQSLRRRDLTLMGTTSLWMFPIYGTSFLLSFLYKLIKKGSWFFRGLCYMFAIFSGEYLFGKLLSAKQICPWNYSRSKSNINSLIRLDYAPLWFLLGLALERFLFNRDCSISKK